MGRDGLKGAWIDLGGVALDDGEAALGGGGEFGQERQKARIHLHGHDPGAGLEEGASEATGAWADLQDHVVFADFSQAGNFAGDVEVEEEVLAERFLGQEAVGLKTVPQGRQAGEVHAARRR